VPARPVTIFALELLEIGEDRLRCRIECSAGTYVRSLAERLAQRLGSVGHVIELSRLSVGSWRLEEACAYDWLRQAPCEELMARVRPLTFEHAPLPRT
jgi:tRNA pseudouridine55 synthase